MKIIGTYTGIWKPLKFKYLVPLALAAFVISIYCLEPITTLLQYDRQLILEGQYWRLFTGHFTHWTARHLFWDLVVFTGLGIFCYRHHAVSFWLVLIGSPPVISVLLWFRLPEVAFYRGLSGVDTALLTLLALSTMYDSFRLRDRGMALFSILLISALILKCVFELLTSTMLFVTSSSFVPVPAAHLAGMVYGIAVWIMLLLNDAKGPADR